MDAKVYSVETVSLHINKSNPPQLVIHASGLVNSSGWRNGRLIPRVYVDKPKDGIQDFDFIAMAPTGLVLWVMSPIAGDGAVVLDDWMKGVRIHATSNSKEAMLDDEDSVVSPMLVPSIGIPQPGAVAADDGGEIPVPFFRSGGRAEGEDPVVHSTGYSDAMSFDGALQDAIKRLPADPPDYPDQLKVYTIVNMCVELGGIVGFSRLRVDIRGTRG